MDAELLTLTSQIVSAYVSKNSVPASELPALIGSINKSLKSLGQPQAEPEAPVDLKPAVPIKKSVTPDYIVCLEDGKKLKMLKRHLMSSYNLTVDDYKKKWGLPSDYPVVAPNYASQRSELAKKLGLGRRAAQ